MSKHVSLSRIEISDAGTMGRIAVDGKFVCFAVERPWLDNRRNVSCIPPGRYDLAYVDSPKFGRRLEVKDVPDRTHILVHAGTGSATRSVAFCPGWASARAQSRALTRVATRQHSGKALEKLEALLPTTAPSTRFGWWTRHDGPSH